MEARSSQNNLKIPIYCSSFAITQTSCHSLTVDKGSSKSHFIWMCFGCDLGCHSPTVDKRSSKSHFISKVMKRYIGSLKMIFSGRNWYVFWLVN